MHIHEIFIMFDINTQNTQNRPQTYNMANKQFRMEKKIGNISVHNILLKTNTLTFVYEKNV